MFSNIGVQKFIVPFFNKNKVTTFCKFFCATDSPDIIRPGSAKVNGREPKSCLGQVRDYQRGKYHCTVNLKLV
jgi:hypothetical protein